MNESKQTMTDEQYNKSLFDFTTELFIKKYKHIESNEYADLEKFINQYTSICRKIEAYDYFDSTAITKYITENFNRDTVLNWLYIYADEIVFGRCVHHILYNRVSHAYADCNTMMECKKCLDTESWNLKSKLRFSLIEYYMQSNDENDLKIIQIHFPGFEYSGTENIHKVFWSTDFNKLCEYSQADLWSKFIDKYK